MDRLASMRAFQRVAETGSFSIVARESGVAQPTISKQISALEKYLGAQLLNRTSRNVGLTEAGQEFYQAISKLLADLDVAESRIGRRQAAPSGTLRATLSAGFGHMHIMPLLPAFLDRYPEISFDIVISDRFLDLVEDGLDVAIRLGHLEDSSLIARRIGFSRRLAVAGRNYLDRYGAPVTPADLSDHECIGCVFHGTIQEWRFDGAEGTVIIPPSGRVRANDAENIRQAVLSGLGVAHAPGWLFHKEIASGEVQVLFDGWLTPAEPIHAVRTATRQPSTKVKVFIDFLAEAFSRHPYLRG
ncbi:MAG TPA: LysR family transcriptional regulator [Bradyrhizobium sp.]|nr:LysR family transcriptional regulator [Bradyrhizobium sp.]